MMQDNTKLRMADSYQKLEKMNRGRRWQEIGPLSLRHLVESSVYAHNQILRLTEATAAAIYFLVVD